MTLSARRPIAPAVYSGAFAISGLPRTVAADFLGMTFFNYPSGTLGTAYSSSPKPPSFKYKTAISWDFAGWGASTTTWGRIEQSPGVYTWSALDSWAATHYAAGAELFYQLALVPGGNAFNAGPYSQNNSTAPSSGYPASFTGAGGPLTTAGLVAISNFVTNLLTRYSGRGTPFTGIEWWTEPDANQNLASPTVGQGYWWGNAASLVDMGYVVYRAAKQAGLATVFGPGYFGPASFVTQASSAVLTMTLTALGTLAVGNTITGATSGASGTVVSLDTTNKIIGYTVTSGTFANAENIQKGGVTQGVSSAVNTTVQGYQTCDEYNIDTFNYGPPNLGIGLPQNVTPQVFDIVTWFNKYTAAYAAQAKPLNMMSIGTDASGGPASGGSTQTVNYQSRFLNSNWFYTWWMRTLMAAAAIGVKRCNIYGYDGPLSMNQNWSGDFEGTTLIGAPGCIQVMNDIQNKVAGKTINSASYINGGAVSLGFSDGSSLTV